jgi:hypothetical protein
MMIMVWYGKLENDDYDNDDENGAISDGEGYINSDDD